MMMTHAVAVVVAAAAVDVFNVVATVVAHETCLFLFKDLRFGK